MAAERGHVDISPSAYAHAVRRWGEPVGTQFMRENWTAIVNRARTGLATIVLGETERFSRGIVVRPIGDLGDWVGHLHKWSISQARANLATVLTYARNGGPQVLTRHGVPVAAITSLWHDYHRGVPLDATEVMRDGGRIVLDFEHGATGVMGYDGDVAVEPYPDQVQVTATDQDGNTIGHGTGETLIDAIRDLHRPVPEAERPQNHRNDEPPF
jgi:prevent-host-death family protein